MTLSEAKVAVGINGTPISQVYGELKVRDAIAIRAWFVANSKVPNLAARAAAVPVLSGRICHCGGMLVRTGSCETCQSCGHNEGCG